MKTLRTAVSIVLTLAMLLSLCATAFAAGTPFVDVAEDAWYYEDVMAVSAANIMLGTDTTHFSPDGSLTRAMMATILWRLDGEPKGYTCDFTDVEGKDPIEWGEVQTKRILSTASMLRVKLRRI